MFPKVCPILQWFICNSDKFPCLWKLCLQTFDLNKRQRQAGLNFQTNDKQRNYHSTACLTSRLATGHEGRGRGREGLWEGSLCVRAWPHRLISTAEAWQTGGLNINKPHMALLFCWVPRWKATAAPSTKTNTSVARHAAGGLHFNAFVGFPKYASISSWMGSLQVHKARWRLSFQGWVRWVTRGRRVWWGKICLHQISVEKRLRERGGARHL